MNFFTDLNKTKSVLLPSKDAPNGFRTCTPCCPFDTRNLPHPQYPSTAILPSETVNSEACCLSKLRVNCRIRCEKKKRKWAKDKRYDSTHSSPSVKRSLSSSSAISEKRKRNRSSTNSNNHHHYDSIDHRSTSSSSSVSTTSRSNDDEEDIVVDTSSSDESLKVSARRLTKNSNYRSDRQTLALVDPRHYPTENPSQIRINQKIEHLRTSIDHLTHLITHSASNSSLMVRSTSWFDRFRWFFAFFKSSSPPSPTSEHLIHDECEQILEQHHLSKAKLISIYHLFDRNETIFLTWLRTIMPQYLLPLLLNYVKHFQPMSIEQQ